MNYINFFYKKLYKIIILSLNKKFIKWNIMPYSEIYYYVFIFKNLLIMKTSLIGKALNFGFKK